jgi:hypothetical protein
MDFGEALEDVVRRARLALASRLLAAAVLLQAEAKRDYSRSNPYPHDNPAPRGEFPRGRTWNLRDSIAIVPTTPQAIAAAGQTVRVGYLPAAFYGAALANRGWKGIEDTYDRVYLQLVRIIGGV